MNDEAGAVADPEWREREKERMTGPFDTIREALALHKSIHASGEAQTARSVTALDTALAALTELEQQLAAAKPWPSASSEVQFCLHERRCLELREAEARLLAAETALAEANQRADRFDDEAERHGLRAAEWKVAHDEQEARAVAAETALTEAKKERDLLREQLETEVEHTNQAINERQAASDPDYSPAYQDEYQRLWHEAAAQLEAAEQRANDLADALRAIKNDAGLLTALYRSEDDSPQYRLAKGIAEGASAALDRQEQA